MCFEKCLYGTPYIVFTVRVHCIAMCFANVSFPMYFWATLGPLVAMQGAGQRGNSGGGKHLQFTGAVGGNSSPNFQDR